MPSLAELEQEITGKRSRALAIFEKGVEHLTTDEVNEAQRLNRELDDLAAKAATQRDLEASAAKLRAAQQQADDLERKHQRLNAPQPMDATAQPQAKTVREYLHAVRGEVQSLKARPQTAVIEMPDIDLKTLITLTTINRQNIRSATMVPLALEDRTVGDLLLQGNLDGNTLEYYEETTFTNNAATVAEGGTKPESAFAYTLRTEPMRKIAHNVPMTDEVLEDNAGLQAQIEGRLVFGVQRAEETQILSGTGVAPQLTGILNRAGIQTQAKATDPAFDAIYKAITKVRNVAFADPTAVVLNPTDWQNMVLTRTADGLYILGNPAGEAPQRIWGLDVRATTAMTLGTALVGAFRPYAQLFRRGGITVTMSTEHSTFFAENKVLIQAEERVLLAVYRPSAFCTVTGL